jgi:hypothetical protein
MKAAAARAEEVGQRFTQVMALYYAGLLEARLGASARMLTLANRLDEIVVADGLAQGGGPARWLRGCAMARLGAADAGYALIVEGFEHSARGGMLAGGTAALGYAAEALIRASRWSDARKQLQEALALAQRIGERLYLPDLMLLEARVALGRKECDIARASMHAALAEARSQQALWLELEALVALCELDRPAADDLEALKAACGRMREGSDTALVMRARELIG